LISLCPKPEEEEDEEVPDEISRLLGHLKPSKSKTKNIKKCVQNRAFTYKDWREILPSCFKNTLQQGQPPLLPSVYNVEFVEVPSIGVLLKSKLDWTQNA